MSDIKSNLEHINSRIDAACARSGRERTDVTLIAVSKTKPVEAVMEAMDCGCLVFGENKVQELRDKTAAITDPLHWHMIGHLQVNKVKYLPGMVDLIHSVDNEKLALEIDKQAAKHGIVMDVLCEVNVAGEDTKFGLAPENTKAFVTWLSKFEHLRVKGLMTIAPYTEDAETNRPYFRALKELIAYINAAIPSDKQMDILSMGMTGDFEVAIEEGATMVRVGTGIFGERSYPV